MTRIYQPFKEMEYVMYYDGHEWTVARIFKIRYMTDVKMFRYILKSYPTEMRPHPIYVDDAILDHIRPLMNNILHEWNVFFNAK